MHCNSTVTSTGNFVASRSYCIFTVVTFYSVLEKDECTGLELVFTSRIEQRIRSRVIFCVTTVDLRAILTWRLWCDRQ